MVIKAGLISININLVLKQNCLFNNFIHIFQHIQQISINMNIIVLKGNLTTGHESRLIIKNHCLNICKGFYNSRIILITSRSGIIYNRNIIPFKAFLCNFVCFGTGPMRHMLMNKTSGCGVYKFHPNHTLNPIKSAIELERFTNQFHQSVYCSLANIHWPHLLSFIGHDSFHQNRLNHLHQVQVGHLHFHYPQLYWYSKEASTIYPSHYI